MGALPLDDDLAHRLAGLDGAGLRRVLPAPRGGAADFSSNDYLGLAGDPRIADVAARALRGVGTGSGAARLIAGNHPLHEALEAELAAWKGTEAALLFPSGYAANTGAVPALVGRGDAVYCDALNHASLIDGCRLSRAAVRVFPHGDVAALERMLAEDAGRFARRMVVADTVFSMDGDLLPLPAVLETARRHGAWTYLDDAHGTGVLGREGRGAAEHWGVEGVPDVVMGTLGKALGTAGAFVAGSARLRDWLLNRARTFVFTTGSPPALAAAALEALRIARAEPWRRERLRRTARALRAGLARMGHPAAGEADGHIVPVVLGDAGRTMQAGAALRERGLLVGAVRPPTVPPGGARLRITASAAHGEAQVERLLAALRRELPAPCSRAADAACHAGG